MNSEEIRVEAQLTSGLQLDTVTSFKWVKDCIKDMSKLNYKIGKITKLIQEAIPDIEYPLKGLLKIVKVTQDGMRKSPNFNFVVDNYNNITFKEAGAYTVEYYALQDMPKTPTEELLIPEEFQDCIEYYLAYKIRGRLFGADDSKAIAFHDMYQKHFADAVSAINNKNIRGRRMPPRR